jgi:anti-sigma-K factor RskA
VNREPTLEDHTILAAVEALERGDDPCAGALPADETAETLARLYTEVLGLLPRELDPAAPSPEVKARLMAAATLAAPSPPRQAAASPGVDAAGPVPPPAAAPARLPDPFPSIDPFPLQPVAGARRQLPRPRPLAARRSIGWPGALAAGLILALAGLSGWLWSQQASQKERLAGIERELQVERQKEAAATQRAEQYRSDFTEVHTLKMVTAPAALVCALRPVGTPPLQPDARGALFVAADHQHWHLSIEGLKPAAPGKVYQLWFLPDQGPPVVGSVFAGKTNERYEVGSDAMPPNTKSAMVTVEEVGGSLHPSGPEVLRAAGMMQVL